jgi:hypothetical protein
MPWTREFVTPIVLKDGKSLTTLSDARGLIKSLPASRRTSEDWLYAAGLLAEAAIGRNALASATTQLKVALRVEGLI